MYCLTRFMLKQCNPSRPQPAPNSRMHLYYFFWILILRLINWDFRFFLQTNSFAYLFLRMFVLFAINSMSWKHAGHTCKPVVPFVMEALCCSRIIGFWFGSFLFFFKSILLNNPKNVLKGCYKKPCFWLKISENDSFRSNKKLNIISLFVFFKMRY